MHRDAPTSPSEARRQLLQAVRRGTPAQVAALLAQHPDLVDARNAHGGSPVREAVRARRPEIVALLLERGASPDCPAGHFGGTALRRTIANRYREMARLLLDHGADPSRQDSTGKTALHEAVVAGTVAWVRLILGYGPDATLRTRRSPTQPGGETALDYARRRRKPALVRLLEAAAPSPQVKTPA